MSTDFSIKPVGAPVAAPIVQPIREAAAQAIKTELPPSATVTAADAGVAARYDSNVVSRSMSNQVVIDREAASIVYQVVDNRTSQVVRQFPEEAVLLFPLSGAHKRRPAPARDRSQGLGPAAST